MKYIFIISFIFIFSCNYKNKYERKYSVEDAVNLNDYAVREFQKYLLIKSEPLNQQNIIDSISLAIRINPSNNTFYKNKAMILYHFDKVKEAINVLESYDSNTYEYDPMITRIIAKYYFSLSIKEYNIAISYYEKKLNNNPSDIWIQCEIISLKKYTKGINYAREEINKLRNEYPENETILNYIDIIKSDL